MALNTEVLFEAAHVHYSGALLEVLGSWGEEPFISGKQGEMPNILGALQS